MPVTSYEYSMRIIAGLYKGRRLVSFDEDHIRPTTDRVKESLFNIISAKIPDSKVLDLYAGTGNLGLEALSRGAAEIVSVEKSPRSLKIISENIKALGVVKKVIIYRDDVIRFLEKFAGPPFEIILVDPPFPSQICTKTLEALSKCPACSTDSIIAIEHSKKEPLAERIDSLRCVDSRSYGDKILSFFIKEVT